MSSRAKPRDLKHPSHNHTRHPPNRRSRDPSYRTPIRYPRWGAGRGNPLDYGPAGHKDTPLRRAGLRSGTQGRGATHLSPPNLPSHHTPLHRPTTLVGCAGMWAGGDAWPHPSHNRQATIPFSVVQDPDPASTVGGRQSGPNPNHYHATPTRGSLPRARHGVILEPPFMSSSSEAKDPPALTVA